MSTKTVNNIAAIDWQTWVTGDHTTILNEWLEEYKIAVLDSEVKSNNIAWILESDKDTSLSRTGILSLRDFFRYG